MGKTFILKFAFLMAVCAFVAGCTFFGDVKADPNVPPAITGADEYSGQGEPPQGDADGEFVDPFAESAQGSDDSESLDPIEPVNRKVFWINKQLYFYFLKPLSTGYKAIVPEPTRKGVKNVFINASTPIRAANLLLQLRFTDFMKESVRFIANSLLGFGGFIDIAKEYGDLPYLDEDLGQTLGYYGAGPGMYIVLPLLGPSTVRDAAGRTGDLFLDPATYLRVGPLGSAAIYGGDSINDLSLDDNSFESILNESVDPYSTIRNGYLQRRESKIKK